MLLAALIGLTVSAGIALRAEAATVALGDATGNPGQAQVALPMTLTLASGEQVSAFTLDVYFDPALAQWQAVALEPAVAALGKDVQSSVVAPGHIRLVVYGTDQRTLSSGIIGQCLMGIPASAATGTTLVTLRDGFTVSPLGVETPLVLYDGRLWIEAPPPAQSFQEVGGQVVIEAEHFGTKIPRSGQDWVLGSAQAGFSGTGYMEALPNIGANLNTGYVTTSPELVYTVSFTTPGTYYVWVRGYGDNDVNDSIHAGVDGTGPASADRISGFPVGWTWSRDTMDSAPATLTIATPGVHTIHLWMREDGFIADKLLLRTDSSATAPSGTGPAESARGGSSTPPPPPTPPADTTPPVISGVTVSSITTTGATVSWTTNEPARATLAVGTTTGYGTTLNGDTSLSTAHQVVLTGFTSSTTYHFRITATDAASNSASTTDATFTTLTPPDTTPPQVSGITVTNLTTTGATISWTTNELARTVCSLGTTTAYGTTVNGDTSLSTAHQAVVTGLTAGITYHYSIAATDAAGNSASTTDATFTTLTPPDTTAPTLIVTSPASGATFATTDAIPVAGTAVDDRAGVVTVTVNGTAVSLGAGGSFSTSVTGLTAGPQTLTVQATDAAGNASSVQRSITVQAPPPSITIVNPTSGATVNLPVSLVFTVTNVQLALGGPHVQIQVNARLPVDVYDTNTYLITNLKGPSTVTVTLVDANEVPLPGANTQASVTFRTP